MARKRHQTAHIRMDRLFITFLRAGVLLIAAAGATPSFRLSQLAAHIDRFHRPSVSPWAAAVGDTEPRTLYPVGHVLQHRLRPDRHFRRNRDVDRPLKATLDPTRPIQCSSETRARLRIASAPKQA